MMLLLGFKLCKLFKCMIMKCKYLMFEHEA
jgi:hypothetical protein